MKIRHQRQTCLKLHVHACMKQQNLVRFSVWAGSYYRYSLLIQLQNCHIPQKYTNLLHKSSSMCQGLYNSSYMTLIGVLKRYGQVHMIIALFPGPPDPTFSVLLGKGLGMRLTDLQVVNLYSSLVYFMMTHTFLYTASKLPINTLVARQLPTN